VWRDDGFGERIRLGQVDVRVHNIPMSQFQSLLSDCPRDIVERRLPVAVVHAL
jgi:hypothetical protein